jgi:SagB-type dehydrogenase family enzyme
VDRIHKIFFVFIIIVSIIVPVYGESIEKDMIILPAPEMTGSITLEKAISQRRSVRSFADKDVTWQQIGQLLWSAQGITNKKGNRAAPSAGALYPLEIYLVYKKGFYKYIPQGHKLRLIYDLNLSQALQKASLSQPWVGTAAVNIIICADYNRITSRYGDRGIRYTDIEVGHVAQNIHLQAVALGLGSVPIGAFNDKEVSKVFSLPENEVPIYIIPIGYSK